MQRFHINTIDTIDTFIRFFQLHQRFSYSLLSIMGAAGSVVHELESAPSEIEEFRGSKECHIDFHIQTEFEGKLDLVAVIHNYINISNVCRLV